MKTRINKEELRREWILEGFWDKLIFVIGYGVTVLMIVSFTVGFIQGVLG